MAVICGGSIDWAATGAMLQGWGTWVGSIAVVIAAKLGRDAVSDWRRQKQIEHAIVAADRVLTAAYDVKSSIEGIRANMMFGGELKRAEEKLVENGLVKADTDDARWKRMITAQGFFNRLADNASYFQELWKVMPAAKAYFGEEAEAALLELVRQRSVISAAAEGWVDEDGNDPEFQKKLRGDLWRGHGKYREQDAMANAVDAQISTLDRMLLPILRADYTPCTPATEMDAAG